jgi:hypothetical protein
VTAHYCRKADCGVPLEPRPAQTKEQAWTGQWFDHPRVAGGLFGHTSSLLVPSEELQAAYDAAAENRRATP